MKKVTKSDTNQKLSATQQKALNELLSGKTDGEAAEIAGVTRKTVNTWKNADPVFQAELNKRNFEIWENFLRELNLTVGDSLATIREAIKEGDVKTARWFFDKIDFGDIVHNYVRLSEPLEPTDPEEIMENNLRKLAREFADKELERRRIEDPCFVDIGIGDQLTEKFYQRFLNASQE